eukprot:6187460-Pleurochrysis_carterae.AAC.5
MRLVTAALVRGGLQSTSSLKPAFVRVSVSVYGLPVGTAITNLDCNLYAVLVLNRSRGAQYVV